ncbi:MAG: thiamine pyrophosphate-binding protein [Thermoproteota archaeon]|nr:thiamine pyrophosphate-binding protein [Thermoproteota archaeon]
MENTDTVSSYLIQKLHEYGVKHIFGVPGDYILGFYDELIRSNMLKVINTCDEQGAGFAADAYARVKGFGVVCVTYCVGGLKVVNATAQAYAEKSPVAVISGAPGTKERTKNPLLHHVVREYDTQQKIFEHITVASTVLNDPSTARAEIDRVLSMAFRYKRPVYIELPRDMVSIPIVNVSNCMKGEYEERIDPMAMAEAVEEATAMINASQEPVIVAGVEIQRFRLQDEMLQLIEKTGIPVVATILSKSVISENYPYYLGLYEGAMGDDRVREVVESSDCLILLGALMTDINFGVAVTPINQSHTIYVTSEKLCIRHHNFENVGLQYFIRGLRSANITRREPLQYSYSNRSASTSFLANTGKKITVERLFLRLASFITADTIVIADVGDSLFGALDLVIQRDTEFLAPAFYTSMGFAVPAAIGAQLADPKLRPLVIVGDGAFQMTGMEISSALRYQLNPIVIVLNNDGYGTERRLLDGPFNDLQHWEYKSIPGIVGGGRGFIINTEDEFDLALEAANQYSEGFCILDVRLDPNDGSAALKRLTDVLGKRVR